MSHCWRERAGPRAQKVTKGTETSPVVDDSLQQLFFRDRSKELRIAIHTSNSLKTHSLPKTSIQVAKLKGEIQLDERTDQIMVGPLRLQLQPEKGGFSRGTKRRAVRSFFTRAYSPCGNYAFLSLCVDTSHLAFTHILLLVPIRPPQKDLPIVDTSHATIPTSDLDSTFGSPECSCYGIRFVGCILSQKPLSLTRNSSTHKLIPGFLVVDVSIFNSLAAYY